MSAFAAHLMMGSAWMIGARWAMRLIGLLSTVILARLLVPEDFGIIAMAMIVVGLLETIAYAGVDLALMRDGRSSREHYDTAWTVQLIQGALVALLLLAAAPFATGYFAEPRAAGAIQVLALRSLIGGLQNIGVVEFRKELNFAKEFRFTLYTKLLNFLILVGAALVFRNYWAIVLAMASGSIIVVVLSFGMHPYRPRLSLARVSEIWGFSQWLMVSRIGAYLSNRTDSFCVGAVLGTSAMGGYHVASELSSMPSSELVMPVRRALYPTLAKLETDPEAFNSAVLSSFAVIAALCLSVGMGLMALAPDVVRLFLGAKWIEVIPVVQLLAVHGSLSALVLVLEVPLWVKGQTRLSAVQTWLEFGALVPLLWWLTHQLGATGAALARVGVGASMVPLMMLLVARTGCVRSGQLASVLWRPLLASFAMAAAVLNIGLDGLPLPLLMAIKIGLGGIAYGVALLLLWLMVGRPDGVEAQALRKVRSLLAARALS